MLMLGSEVMERQLLEAFLAALRELPEVQAEFDGIELPSGTDRGHDAQVELQAGGKAATLLIRVKKAVYPRDVRQALWQNRESARKRFELAEGRRPVFVLAAQSISPGAKELLRNERVGYYDSGGSLFLSVANIYIYVDKPPPKSLSRYIRSLFSGRRAQVLHAVLMRNREWFGVKEIANRARVSPATASQVLTELERFDWVVSRGQGPGKERHLQEPGALLDAWVNQLTVMRPLSMTPVLRTVGACGGVGGEVRRGLRSGQGGVRDHPRGCRATVRAVSVDCLPGALSPAGRPGSGSGAWRAGCSIRRPRREPCGH